MSTAVIGPQDVLKFWFGLPEQAYFTKDPELDADIASRFGKALELAKSGELDHWINTLEGALALVILLDQFSRNIFRGSPEMFAADANAIGIARQALEGDAYKALPREHLSWLVIPFMHSERLEDQEQCVALCEQYGLDDTTPYAIDHADIIRRFGRFPHRNRLLNRETTTEEQAFLDQGGFAG